MLDGGVPPCASPCESAIEKQAASAAAISSSGLVPAEASSARARHVRPTSVAAPLPSENVPEPLIRSPFHVALAVCSAAIVAVLLFAGVCGALVTIGLRLVRLTG